MKYLSFLLFLLSFCFSFLQAQICNHSRGRTDNYLMPELTFSCTPREIGDNSGVAFLAEGGRRNLRFNGTYGMLFDEDNRFKVSAEYLQQKLGYHFSTGKADRWVRQYAIGAAYGHEFCNPYITCGEITGYFSHAPNHYLGDAECAGELVSRRIAGSYAYGVEASATISLWPCAFLFLDAIYDSVAYQRKFHSRKYVNGFGGSVGFSHQFYNGLGVDLKAEFRRPFNYYRAGLRWFPSEYSGLSLGVYASYVRGKYQLPNNTTAGLEVTYTFSDLFSPSSWFGLEACEPVCCCPQLRCWVSKPAVYLPQVLAIAEESICQLPTSTPIPDFTFTTIGPYSINAAPFFSNPEGGPIVFSAVGLPPQSSIDANTGVISGIVIAGAGPFSVTVTAKTSCGTSSQTFTITFCLSPSSTTIPSFARCAPGAYTYDVSSFFTNPPGSQPLVFSATGLPPGATINPVTGVISGINVADTNIYNVTVSATNGCGSTSQTFTMTFTCPAPTSVTIPNLNDTGLVGDPYSYDVSVFFTSPCGQPFTFSATGLPLGTTINPVTGLILGTVPSLGAIFNVTVTGTTGCGQTSQTFVLSFQSS